MKKLSILALVLFSTTVFAAKSQDWKSLYKSWKYPNPIPNFQLVDHNGKNFHLDRYKDDYLLVGFIFTQCPVEEACPMTSRNMERILNLWKKAKKEGKTKGKNLKLLAVTIDPEVDTPKVLKAYGLKWTKDLTTWTFATGPKELVDTALPSLFNVVAQKSGPANITHNVKLGLLAPGLKDVRDWKDNEFKPADVIQAILKHQ